MSQSTSNKAADDETCFSPDPTQHRPIKVESPEESSNSGEDASAHSRDVLQIADPIDDRSNEGTSAPTPINCQLCGTGPFETVGTLQSHTIAAHSIFTNSYSHSNGQNGSATVFKAEAESENFSSIDEEIALAESSRRHSLSANYQKSPLPGNFTCQQCQASFHTLIQFIDHMRTTHLSPSTSSSSPQSTSPLKCHICERQFPSAQSKVNHMVDHFITTSSAYTCNMCDKPTSTPFTSLHQLYQHFANSHTNVLYRCSICLKLFSKDTAYQAHVTTHSAHATSFGCVACSLSFESYELLSTHVLVAHDVQSDLLETMCSSKNLLPNFSSLTSPITGKWDVSNDRGQSRLVAATSRSIARTQIQRFNKVPPLLQGSKRGEPIRTTRYVQRRRRQLRNLFKCRICDMPFSSSQQLSDHSKVHEVCLTKAVMCEK